MAVMLAFTQGVVSLVGEVLSICWLVTLYLR